MASSATSVPTESALLCESCGYVLDGLPDDSRCPECGKLIAESSRSLRKPPAWEQTDGGGSAVTRFIGTTASVIFAPARFYRTLNTRGESPAAFKFAMVHWAIASILLATAFYFHADWFASLGSMHHTPWQVLPATAVFAFLCLWGLTHIAAQLTAWEAAYRGLRLPYIAVVRAMYYHAAHYLPVAVVAAATVLGYRWLIHARVLTEATSTNYLYVLCAEVVIGAFFLFNTYWIGMRKMMYANA
jgi:hypothetical protein